MEDEKLAPGELGEDEANHEGLDEAAQDGLEGDHQDGMGALSGGLPGAVPDSVLGLQGEQEARGEVPDLQDAGRGGGRGVEVTVKVEDQEVAQTEGDPGGVEARCEDAKTEGPGDVLEGGVAVGEEVPPLLGDVLVGHIHASVLLHDPLLVPDGELVGRQGGKEGGHHGERIPRRIWTALPPRIFFLRNC